MNFKRKYSRIVIVLTIVVLVGTYFRMYQEHPDIKDQPVDFQGNVAELKGFYENKDQSVTIETVVLEGVVTTASVAEIQLDNMCYCQLQDPLLEPLIPNKKVTIMARLVGYDELLEEFKLDQTIILN